MTPDEYRLVNGVLAAAAAFSLAYNISWQWRIGLRDRQRWSAFSFLLSTTLLVVQIGVALLGGPALSVGPRGTLTWVFFCGSAMIWGHQTRRHNLAVERRRRDGEL